MNGEGKPSITLLLDQTYGSGFAAALNRYVRMLVYKGLSAPLGEYMNLLLPKRMQPRLFS
jgi:hypothetical protein